MKTYLVIDEAQNMTPNQVKGIIARAGKDTKIILLGDPNQIDRPYLDERTNGLSYAAEYMKGSSLCWQITLSAEECERAALAVEMWFPGYALLLFTAPLKRAALRTITRFAMHRNGIKRRFAPCNSGFSCKVRTKTPRGIQPCEQ